MIIVRFTGGLGNQLYNYALVLSLKKIYPDTEIKIDINDYIRDFSHTGYILDKMFGVPAAIAHKDECRRIGTFRWYYPGFDTTNLPFQQFRKYYRKIYQKWSEFPSFKKNVSHMIYGYKPTIFNPEVFNLDPAQDWYLSGGWQNLRYFDWNREELKRVYTFQPELNEQDRKLISKMNRTNSVSVHVRRGDYVNTKFDMCDDRYYYTAMDVIRKKVDNCVFFFFSDDVEYVREHFFRKESSENIIIISHDPDDYQKDFHMMGQCKHHIIPNSTFSFWPAYLTDAPDHLTICPQYIKLENNKLYHADYPEHWIKLKNTPTFSGLCNDRLYPSLI